MNNVKKNNKGFSLVELIVVVLIMAIIAVSLAPQVMKWVDNSRLATDRQTADSVVSAAQLALTNKAAKDAVTGSAYSIVINGTNCTVKRGANNAVTTTGSEDAFLVALCDNLGVTFANPITSIKTKSSKTVTISITTAGVVSSDANSVLDSTDID